MRVLFVQFEPDDGPGRIGSGIEALGAICDVTRLYAHEPLPTLDAYDALVVLGGTMNAEDDANHPYLPDVVTMLQEAHRHALPTLGVCLGGQLLARALGARVRRKASMEVGFFPIELTAEGEVDPLFQGLPAPLLTFQWHEDAFDLPPGAVLLADSPRDSYQAFRLGCSYGIQFHPEVDLPTLTRWTAWSGEALSQAADPTTVEELLRHGEAIESAFAAQTRQLCHNLVRIVAQHRTTAASSC